MSERQIEWKPVTTSEWREAGSDADPFIRAAKMLLVFHPKDSVRIINRSADYEFRFKDDPSEPKQIIGDAALVALSDAGYKVVKR